MKIPNCYGELTVDQFQKLEMLKLESLEPIDMACKRLSILSNKDINKIELMKPKDIYDILLGALYLSEPIKGISCPESFTIGFKKFKYIKEISQYTTSQQKDFIEILRQYNNNYISCLPELMSICHLELSIKGWVYNSDNFHKNIELFKKSKLKESLGAVFFYSNCLKNYVKIINDYSENLAANLLKLAKKEAYQDSMNNGVGITV